LLARGLDLFGRRQVHSRPYVSPLLELFWLPGNSLPAELAQNSHTQIISKFILQYDTTIIVAHNLKINGNLIAG